MTVGDLIQKLSALDPNASASSSLNGDRELRRLVVRAFNEKIGEMLELRRAERSAELDAAAAASRAAAR